MKNNALELMMQCRKLSERAYFPFIEFGRGFAYPDDAITRRNLRDVLPRISYRQRECYKNAQRVMLYDLPSRFVYWEGFYAVAPHWVPFHHAWLTYQGKLVDVTLEAAGKSEAHYVGISIPSAILLKFLTRHMTHSPVTEDYKFLTEIFKETPQWLKKQKTSTPTFSNNSPLK